MEYLSRKVEIHRKKFAKCYRLGKYKIWARLQKDEDCPFFQNGRCINREARPLDCRSYPAIPTLKNGKLKVTLSKRCPLVINRKIPADFLKRALKAWKIVSPPKWWLKLYQIWIEKSK